MMGDELRRFMHEILERSDATGHFRIHFASAREVFNMIIAALEGESGDPAQYRDYRLRPIWREAELSQAVKGFRRWGKSNEANGIR
jgi:hypothetical protein